MARTIKDIMELARGAVSDIPYRPNTMESVLFDREFDETEQIVDQYEKTFNAKTTRVTNINGAFIGNARSDWDDTAVKNFGVSNDNMFPDMIRAQTDPDEARPTMSRHTLQSLTPLNVGKPIDLSQALRISAQSSLDYRIQNTVPDVPEDGLLSDLAVYGLQGIKKTIDTHLVPKALKDKKLNTIIDKHF